MKLNIFDQFRSTTGYDIRKFFMSFSDFILDNYKDIVNYYNGQDISQEAFNEFDRLKRECSVIEGLLQFYSKSFKNCEYWELYDSFSNIQIKLMTIDNLSRWLRSSRLDRFSYKVNVNYVLKQNETIESVSKKVGNILYQDEWYKIAIDNDLNEEKYTSSGGNILSITFSNNMNFYLKNIVDSLSKENLYGKDIHRKFILNNGDIECLKGIDSLIQTFETIFMTIKGSIPEFPEDGVSSSSIGSNVNVIGYQYIFRNILEMFQKDDRFKTIDLIDLNKRDDIVYMKIQAKTKINDIIPKEIIL